MFRPNRAGINPAPTVARAFRIGSWAPRNGLISLLAVLLSLTLAGCAAGPKYTPVKPEAPNKWHTELQGGLTARQPDSKTLARWWTTLRDPVLSSLEERAVKGNLDLKKALERIREARALRGIEKAKLFPNLNASGSAQEIRTSAYSTEETMEGGRRGEESKLYKVGFDSSWELDIFGGIRRSIQAAQAELEATREELHDVLVSLLAEVSLNYVEVRTYQERLSAARTNMKAQQHIYELNLSRYHAGLIDELAVQQSRYVLESTRAQIPALETGLERAENRLAVLLGEKPGSLHQELAPNRTIPVPPVTVAVGIPADTLRHRPDVRRAERELAAATARIGVAKSELYPKFNLSGTIGLESVSTGHLWEWVSRTSSFGLNVLWKIFHAGALRQNIKVQTARQKQAFIQYESTVLKAMEEVENALVAYAKEQQRLESLKSAVKAAKLAYEIAWDRYKAGLVDFTDVLDAERSLQSYQDKLAQSEGAVTSNFVRLYKTLGGGWKCLEPLAEKSRK